MLMPLSTTLIFIMMSTLVHIGGCGASRHLASLSPELTPSEAETQEKGLTESLRRQGPSADRFANLANAQLQQGKLARARVTVQRALGLVDDHPTALLVGARAAFKSGEHERADAYYERLRTAKPQIRTAIAEEWARNLLALGRLYLTQGAPNQALEVVKRLDAGLAGRVTNFVSERHDVLLKTIRKLLGAGRVERAREALALADAGEATTGKLAFLKAGLLLATERYKAAAEAFQRWAGDTKQSERWTEIGDFAVGLRKHAFALEAYQKVANGSVADLKRLATTALEATKPDISRDAWLRAAKAVAASGDDGAGLQAATLLLQAARELENRAYLKRAFALYLAATTFAPTHWKAFEAAGRFMSERYDHVSGVPKLVQRYVEARTWSLEALENAIRLLVDTQQVIDASKLLEKAQQRPNAPAALWLRQAHLMHRQHRGVARERALETYIQRAGTDNVEVLTRAARAWLSFGVLTKAEQLASQAYAMSKDTIEVAVLSADVYGAKGMPHDEKRVLDTLLNQTKERFRAALTVGRRYRERNDIANAVRLFSVAATAPQNALRIQAHRALFELHLRAESGGASVAARHLRSWVSLIDKPAERSAVLRQVLDETQRSRDAVPVRIEAITGLLKLEPADASLWAALGTTELLRKRYAQARDAFVKALKFSTRRTQDAQHFGNRFSQLGQERTALLFYDMIPVDEVWGAPTSHLSLGRHYDRAGRRKRATEHFTRYAKALDSESRVRWVLKFGDQMLRSRRFDLARKVYRLALKKSPKAQGAWKGLGTVLLRLGQLDQARHALEKYVALQRNVSGRIRALDLTATLFENVGALSDAARLVEELLLLSNNSHVALGRIADIYRRMGASDRLLQLGRLWEESRSRRNNVRARIEFYRHLEKAGFLELAYEKITTDLAKQRRTRGARRPLAALLEAAASNALKRGKPDKAMEHLDELAMQNSGRPSQWRRVASLLAEAGYPEHAARILAHPLRQLGAPAELFLERGKHWNDAGRIEAAHKDFTEALQRTLSLSETIKKIEVAYRKSGHLERLRQLVARASQLMPNRSPHFLSLGRLLLEQGRIAEASQAFQRFLSVKERGHLEVARAYREAGLPKQALTHYLRSYEHTDKGSEILSESARLLVHLGRAQSDLPSHIQRFLLAAKKPGTAFFHVATVWDSVVGDSQKALAWRKRAWEAMPRLDDHLRLGRLALSTGAFKRASEEFKQYIARYAVERAPQSAASFIQTPASQVLQSYLSRGRYADAEAFLDHVDASLGSTPWVGARRVRLLLAQGKVDEALERLTKHPALLDAPQGAGGVIQNLLDHGLANEALALVDQVIEERGSSHLALWQLRIRARLGRVEDAAESAKILVGDGGSEKHFKAGQILFSEGVLAAAVEHLRKVLDAPYERRDERGKEAPSKRVANAASLLMGARAQQGRPLSPSEQLDLIARASDNGEDIATGYATRARLLFAQGSYPQALAALDEVPTKASKSNEQLRLLVAICVMLDDAKGLVERIRRLSPAHSLASSFRTAAKIAAHMNHPPIALALVSHVLEQQPGDAELRLRAVALALQSGDEDAVERHALAYTRLLERSPRSYLKLSAMAGEHLYPTYAERWARQARQVKGRDQHALSLTTLGLKLIRKSAVKKDINAVIHSAPDPSLGRLRAAELLYELDAPAQLIFETVKPLFGDRYSMSRALQLGAMAAWRMGDTAAAQNLFTQLRKRYPGGLGAPSMSALSTELLGAAVEAGDIEGVKAIIEAASRSGDVAWAYRNRTRFVPGHGVMLVKLARACEDHYSRWSPTTRTRFARLLGQRLSGNRGEQSLSREDKAFVQRVIRFMDGRDASAFAPYDAILQQTPADPTLSNNLAYGLAGRERMLPRALGLVDRAIALNQPYGPDGTANDYGRSLATYLDTKAWVLFKMGRAAEALRHQRRAIHLMGHHPRKPAPNVLSDIRKRLPLYRVTEGGETEVFYHFGVIQKANGLERQARNTFRDCARRAPRSKYGRKCKAALIAPPPR